jgi:PKD repeat protein
MVGFLQHLDNRVKKVFICLLLLSSISGIASATPVLPSEFYGEITINDEPAPVGTVVTAYIRSIERGKIITSQSGIYGGSEIFDQRLQVKGEEGDEGVVISFQINGVDAAERSVFQAGESRKLDLTISIDEPPIANFTADRREGLVPLTIQFTDQSTGEIEGRIWEFGDGNTSNQKNPLYTYITPGSYTVNLTVTGPGGTDTETKRDYVQVIGSQAITGITPEFGYTNGRLIQATISGGNFKDDATVLLRSLLDSDVIATNVAVISSSEIRCTLNLTGVHPGVRSVMVTSHEESPTTLADAFMVRPRGDFNGNMRVDVGDVAKVAWMAAKLIEEDIEADFIGDGHVSGADAAMIAYFYVGKIGTL